MANKMKSLMESILGKMTDESGLFQGGEQGRAFGRIRDLFGGGGGAHENIDAAIESSGGGAGGFSGLSEGLWQKKPVGIGNQPPEHYEEILKAAAPYLYETAGLQIDPHKARTTGYTDANKVDQIIQAIVNTGFGESVPYSDLDNAPPYENKHRTKIDISDYEKGDMTPEDAKAFEEAVWYPEASKGFWPSMTKTRGAPGFDSYGANPPKYGQAPKDITDIIQILDTLRFYDEEAKGR